MKRSLHGLALVVLLAPAFGCVRPCVMDRGTLAHPTMAAGEISVGLEGRVRARSEGAWGSAGPSPRAAVVSR